MPFREIIPIKPKDACRFHGTLELTKVAGNFHIIFGKSLSFFGNHAHMSSIFDNTRKKRYLL
jgi:endoplasmic reticulum-Golgi intermediate compartment protein 2